MSIIIRAIKIVINAVIGLVLLITIAIFIIINPLSNNINNSGNNVNNISSFHLNTNNIDYTKNTTSAKLNIKTSIINISNIERKEILNRAKSMVEVKWTPKYNIIDKYGLYVFIKGKTYSGIPYSMNLEQASSSNDFLSKITNSKVLYGNDCSGFVSAAWGISRQTTLTLLNGVKNGSNFHGKFVNEISWNDLEPGDALLTDNGKGEGHIMLYINSDNKNSDKLNVYEQNVQTLIPFEPLPIAREDVRSKRRLLKQGYIPIRLMQSGMSQ